jgi:hypothetical protein
MVYLLWWNFVAPLYYTIPVKSRGKRFRMKSFHVELPVHTGNCMLYYNVCNETESIHGLKKFFTEGIQGVEQYEISHIIGGIS